jgi:glycopeptide antibiotics resistance protein
VNGFVRETPAGRLLWISGTVAAALFAAYVSLLPFQFRPVSMRELREGLAVALDLRILSGSNFVANVVLFIPLGFLLPGALRTRRLIWIGAVVHCACLALSLSIEALQVLVPGRTPALADVCAQLAGTGLGFAAWICVGCETRRWLQHGWIGEGPSTLRALLAAYVGLWTLASLLPLDVTVSLSDLAAKYRTGGIRVVPFSGASAAAAGALMQGVTIDMILAAPVGALALVGCTKERRGLASGIALATLFIAALEASQVMILSRVADSSDIVSRSVGATLGAFVLASSIPRPCRNPAPGVRRGPVVLAIVLSASLYLLYNWSPFDFVVNSDLLRGRLQALVRVPFYGYYQNPEPKAAADFLTKLLVAMPLGISVGALLSRNPATAFKRLQWTFCSLGALMLFTTVELGQTLIPQRYPDNTDVLISVLGFTAGAIVQRVWQNAGRQGTASAQSAGRLWRQIPGERKTGSSG